MAEQPPYMNGYGYISATLEKIKAAPTPPKFTNDFLHTKLGITSSSARPVIPFLKRIGFLDQSNSPTDRYKEFRNSTHSGAAAAAGLRQGYSALYASNEYVHDLSPSDLEGLVIQVTGLDRSNQTLKAIVASFNALKTFADFDVSPASSKSALPEESFDHRTVTVPQVPAALNTIGQKLNLAYTINLTLPETTNIEVFDAIFQSLNRNILKPE